MQSIRAIVRRAAEAGLAVPAFNVPYLPMIEPVVRAVVDEDCFALVETARLEWVKFEARGPAEVMEAFQAHARPDHVRIHVDHVPAIDEDGLTVDYYGIIERAIALGYPSVMVDGSRLDLEANIEATARVAALAHASGVACEAELGAVLGHEQGPLPPYEELFASGRGFTDPTEAQRFVREAGCDWLSVAVGSIHGAISGVLKDQKKIEARLDLDHLARLREATGVPLVLHGGSGIRREYVLGAMKRGVAKINVAMEIRQAYEAGLRESGSEARAQEAVYQRTRWLLRDYFGLAGSRARLLGLDGSAARA